MKLRRVFNGIDLIMGQRIPRGYGLAYKYECYDKALFLPIPLNLLVRFARDFWWWVKQGRWGPGGRR